MLSPGKPTAALWPGRRPRSTLIAFPEAAERWALSLESLSETDQKEQGSWIPALPHNPAPSMYFWIPSYLTPSCPLGRSDLWLDDSFTPCWSPRVFSMHTVIKVSLLVAADTHRQLWEADGGVVSWEREGQGGSVPSFLLAPRPNLAQASPPT